MKRASVTTTLTLVVLACLLLGTDEIGEEETVPFLFTEDQDVAAVKEPLMTIAPSDTLHSDPYLSAPMTRLEYMLTKIDEHLEDLPFYAMKTIREGFEEDQFVSTTPTITATARYVEPIGKVVVTYDVDGVGAPKQPMRKTCDTMLFYLQDAFPQELRGWSYHNTILGVLHQKDARYYTTVLHKLSKNIVHQVAIVAATGDDSEGRLHFFSCMKETKDAPIVYWKSSTRFDRPPRQPQNN